MAEEMNEMLAATRGPFLIKNVRRDLRGEIRFSNE